jgi:hypothetical protein
MKYILLSLSLVICGCGGGGGGSKSSAQVKTTSDYGQTVEQLYAEISGAFGLESSIRKSYDGVNEKDNTVLNTPFTVTWRVDGSFGYYTITQTDTSNGAHVDGNYDSQYEASMTTPEGYDYLYSRYPYEYRIYFKRVSYGIYEPDGAAINPNWYDVIYAAFRAPESLTGSIHAWG